MMKRRAFLQAAGLGGAAAMAGRGVASGLPGTDGVAAASSSDSSTKGSGMKITRIRFYHNPQSPPTFNQSFHIVTVETDQGITGVGEGGSPDTVKQCASMLIGEDPARIEHLWQMMFRGYFYPAGRESEPLTWPFGTSRARRWAFRFTNCLAAYPASTWSVTPRVFLARDPSKKQRMPVWKLAFALSATPPLTPQTASRSTHIMPSARLIRIASKFGRASALMATGRLITTRVSILLMPCGCQH